MFPVIVTLFGGILVPSSVPLLGMLMFGNLLRKQELQRLRSAENELINIQLFYWVMLVLQHKLKLLSSSRLKF